MPINRAAILQQLKQQLTTQLGQDAEVSLLQLPNTAPTTVPQVSLKLGEETVLEGQNPDAGFVRKLELSVETRAIPATAETVLQSLDAQAESIELALTDQDIASLWMNIKPLRTGFIVSRSSDTFSATMTQHFELHYLVNREEDCPDVNVTAVYLSNNGEPYELVTEIPAT